MTLIEQLDPDVVLLDISLPRMSGLELARLIKVRFPKVRILVLTMHSADEYVRGMLMAGAHRHLLKQASADELLQAVRLVHSNRMLYPRLAGGLAVGPAEERLSKRGASAWQSDILTEREKEILQLIAMGKTSPEIAQQIFLSAKTVDNYRSRILVKLQAHNASEAVAFAIQRGIISLESEEAKG